MKYKQLFSTTLIITLITILLISITTVQGQTTPTITTDKLDYSPGETVIITGLGFTPEASYSIPIIRPDESIVFGDGSFISGWDNVTADQNGDFIYSYILNGIQGTYEINIYDYPWSGELTEEPILTSTFTDSPVPNAVPDVWTPQGLNWVNGQPKGYREGETAAFRVRVDGVTAGEQYWFMVELDLDDSGAYAFTDLEPWDTTYSQDGTHLSPPPDSNDLTGATTDAVNAVNATIDNVDFLGEISNYQVWNITFQATSGGTVYVVYGGHLAGSGDPIASGGNVPEDEGASHISGVFQARLASTGIGDQTINFKGGDIIPDHNPVLLVTKDGPVSAAVGDLITYTITVEHDSTSDMSDVSALSVVDDIAGSATYVSGDDGDAILEAGEVWTYTVDYTVLATDPDPLVNVANATGTDLDGDMVSDIDTLDVPVEYNPVLLVTKDGPVSAAVGDLITYTITVEHDSTSDMSDVSALSVVDDIAGSATYVSGDDGDAILEAGEVWTYTVDYTVLATDPDPLVNVANATGTDLDGDMVSDIDTLDVPVEYNPVLLVTKDGPVSAAVGDLITYTITVEHDSTSDMSDVSALSVVDDIAGSATYVSGDDGDAILEAGEVWTYTVDYTVLATDPDPLVNVANATGTDLDGDMVSDIDTLDVPVEYNPVLLVTKDGPVSAAVGDLITYTITVEHDSTSDMSDVSALSVVDDIAGSATYVSGDDGDAILEAGEVWTYTVDYTVLATDPDPLVNVANATGTDLDGDMVSDIDTLDVPVEYNPVLLVTKDGPVSAAVGDLITYTITVEHDSTSDMSDVSALSVVDDIAGSATYVSGDDGDAILEAGEVWTYTVDYTVLATDPDPLVNVANATGTDLDGDMVSDIDTLDVPVEYNPVLLVTKDGPVSAAVGDLITYTITVEHDSTSDMSDVSALSVVDDIAGSATYVSGDDGDAILEAGEVWTYTVDYTVLATDPDPLVNVANATGTDLDGDMVSDIDTLDVPVEYNPVLLVTKDGPVSAAVGDLITYTITVEHDSTSDMSDVSALSVVDDIAGSATYVSGDDGDAILEAGEVWTYTVDYTVLATDPDPLVNVANATGTDLDGDTITDRDSHYVDIIQICHRPVLYVKKTGPCTAKVGETITYTITVRHSRYSDGSPVSNLKMTDGLYGAVISGPFFTVGDSDDLLEAGEKWTWKVKYTVTKFAGDTLKNVATVTGTDLDGDTITDRDSHYVDIIQICHRPVLYVKKTGPCTAKVGETITYTITVRHSRYSDGSPVSNLKMTDGLYGAVISGPFFTVGDSDDLLEAGEKWTWKVKYTVTKFAGDTLKNVATVTGTDLDGDTITDRDSHYVDIIGFCRPNRMWIRRRTWR